MSMNKIFYHHIPKTGGQTLATRVASAFPLGRSSFMAGDLSFPSGVDQLRSLLRSSDFVEAHVNGPVLKDFNDLDIMVTVRDPISQIASQYLHIRREPASHLHRTVHLLSPRSFFDAYGDFFCNHQARYFVSSFVDKEFDFENATEMAGRMLECMGRAKWYVPTEQIDEFCFLWQLESGRPMMHQNSRVNVADSVGKERAALLEIIAAKPELYSVDLLFWQAAKERYISYKRRILGQILTNSISDNWARVWSDETSGIWLGYGWHQPQFTDAGVEYWAGPQKVSEVRIVRTSALRWLVFSIQVFHKVSENNIVIAAQDGTELPIYWRRLNDDQVMYAVDINGLSNSDGIYFKVPEVWSPAMVDPALSDVLRRSVATAQWSLATEAPAEVLVT
ncbi:hypothetical protein [Burkholderia cepacia]|uniref:hypothetical protein n=1 Tax=Burkholderia cepacia TaxID=292 RepID=UPI0012D9658B|nr:hypothetical protein [Burkholderia cepacia]